MKCWIAETDRVESGEESYCRCSVQRKREEVLHAQRCRDSRHVGSHQGRNQTILTAITCRRRKNIQYQCQPGDQQKEACAPTLSRFQDFIFFPSLINCLKTRF